MLTHELKRGTLYVYLSGDLDQSCAALTRSRIDDLLAHTGARRLVLDLSRLGFMDSSGIGLILGRYRKLSEQGGELLLKWDGPAVERMLKLSGLTDLIRRQA